MANDDDFLWSRQRYTLKHFVRTFENKLPVLVNVTQGYCGVNELLDISKGQVSFSLCYANSHFAHENQDNFCNSGLILIKKKLKCFYRFATPFEMK